jgi:lipid-binding SYLF domain-containing protein
MFSRNRYLIAALSFLFVLTAVSLNTTTAATPLKGSDDQAERAREAAEVLNEVMGIREKGIPEDLLSKAHAIAVIPGVTKGALGIGGRWGKGLVTHRGTNNKWSTPSYLELSGGSVGFQIGVERTDLVLVFTNDEGFRSMLDGKVKLGAEASVAAGPVGRSAEAGTDIKLKSAVWSYSRSKGLFAGVALDGAVLEIDDSGNEKAYGRKVSAEDILLNNRVKMNNVVMPFIQAVEKWAPGSRRISN